MLTLMKSSIIQVEVQTELHDFGSTCLIVTTCYSKYDKIQAEPFCPGLDILIASFVLNNKAGIIIFIIYVGNF